MSYRTQFDREEETIEREFEEGTITEKEYREAMSDIRRGYREAAREAAQEAYDRELDRW